MLCWKQLLLVAMYHSAKCAFPIDIVTEVNSNLKSKRPAIIAMIPDKDPIMSKRSLDHFEEHHKPSPPKYHHSHRMVPYDSWRPVQRAGVVTGERSKLIPNLKSVVSRRRHSLRLI